MKIKLNSKELLERLQYLFGVVSANNAMPILESFLFEVSNQELKITASDLDNTIIATMPVSCSGECALAIPSKVLIEILKALPQQPIEMNVMKNNTVEIVSASGNYSVAYNDADNFPRPKLLENPATIEINSKALVNAIGKTLFAVGNDMLRPVLTGVLFQFTTEGVTFVATDAHRMSKYSRNDVRSAENVDFIVPKKPLSIMKTILGNSDVSVEIQYNINNLSFKIEGYELLARLIEGKFPNYDAVIPKDNPNQFVISRTELIGSLNRVSIFSNKTTHEVAVNRTGTELEIKAEDADYSTNGKEKLQCEPIGEDIQIGFNARFLNEVLNNIDSENVKLETSAPNRAGVIRPEDGLEEGEDILMLVMPVMLKK